MAAVGGKIKAVSLESVAALASQGNACPVEER